MEKDLGVEPSRAKDMRTPGPWRVYSDPDCEGECKDRFPGIEATNATIIIWGEENDTCGVRGVTRQVALANARLIAAAPDCLAANREAADFIRAYFGPIASDDPKGWSEPEAYAVYEQLKSTVAKAEGRELEA